MADTKCNNIQTSLTNNEYRMLMKAYKKRKHDISKESMSRILREEVVLPYIRSVLDKEERY